MQPMASPDSACAGRFPRQAGFTLIELLVAIAIIGVLLAVLLPALEKGREHANTVACASNLHQIGQAMQMYADENGGTFPRTAYKSGSPVVAGTGVAASDPFGPGGPQPNDTSAAIWLLIRRMQLPTKLFADPYNDAVEYSADVADPTKTSNFTDYHSNLGYSLASPYGIGFQRSSQMGSDTVLGADLNPGTPGDNSPNHEDKGQNVLFADVHVEFKTTRLCGPGGDDIYANAKGVVWGFPVTTDDTLLLPAAK
jgi:prepilin-type N-terminal cleavage/methylation domain-containing protein